MGTTGRFRTKEKGCVIRLTVMIPAVFFLAAILVHVPVRAANPVVENCPLAAHRFQAKLVQAHLTGAVGEEIIVSFALDPPEPPQGFFLSVNMRALQKPEPANTDKPELLTGFPETSVVFRTPGSYRYAVVVSLIAKSSCGGVKADTLFRGEIQIDVSP